MSLYCDKCGMRILSRRITIEETGEKVCVKCYDKHQGPPLGEFKVSAFPEIIRMFDTKLALMGKYKDGTKRLIVTIPKKKVDDFLPDERYDVIFKLKVRKARDDKID